MKDNYCYLSIATVCERGKGLGAETLACFMESLFLFAALFA